jgi:hypothetical protein
MKRDMKLVRKRMLKSGSLPMETYPGNRTKELIGVVSR